MSSGDDSIIMMNDELSLLPAHYLFTKVNERSKGPVSRFRNPVHHPIVAARVR
jgi:hypothetical protein